VEKLSLRKNYVRLLPDSIGKLNNLTHLNLRFTLLNALPETIGNLTKLEYLWMQTSCWVTMAEESMRFVPSGCTVYR
jgi:Leucine-rich repeat (LRR) protein